MFLKVAWVACVVGGNSYGLAVIFAMLGLSMLQKNIAADWPYAVGLGFFGLFLDSAWMYFGILDYTSTASLTVAGFTLAPGWIVGGSAPFSYMAGERFGAVVIPSYENLIILGLVWFVVYYALFSLTKYINANRQDQADCDAVTQSF